MPTRPSILTRRRILKSASRVFAGQGYEGASIRDIVTKADVNQAAINYHFGSKEGLYRAVLEMALAALTNADAGSPAISQTPIADLHAFVRPQFRPMLELDTMSGHRSIFVRNREQLAHRPLAFQVDQGFVDRLGDLIAGWAAAGLSASKA